jgi:hypothetical protein
MKQKYIVLFQILGISLLMLTTHSCYNDLGNYKYDVLDEIAIDTSNLGIKPEYAVYRYDELTIAPRIYFNGTLVDPGNAASYQDKLDFTWSIFQAHVGAPVYSRDTLSHDPVLSTIITKSSGTWIVLLTVKQRETEVEAYLRFRLQVDEIISDGWMVLYERDKNSDVGLIVDDYIKSGVVKERLFIDLYSASNGKPLDGLPKTIIHSIGPIASREILIASASNLVAVDYNSFEATYTFNDLFWNAPQNQNVTYVGANYMRREIVLNDNRIHSVNFMTSGSYRSNYFGEQALGNYGRLAEWAASYYASTYDAVVYDRDNKRFKCVLNGGSEVTAFQNQNTESAFDVNNVGMDFVASDWGRNYMEYSIMQEGNTCALLVSDFYRGAVNNLGIQKYDMSNSPGVSSISSMAAATDGEYIYYSANDALYLYKYNTNTTAEKVWTASSGEEITCVRIQKFYYPQFEQIGLPINRGKVLYVATWNESTQNGKVYEYTIDPSSGAINQNSERVRNGFGKVKDMSWKWTL